MWEWLAFGGVSVLIGLIVLFMVAAMRELW